MGKGLTRSSATANFRCCTVVGMGMGQGVCGVLFWMGYMGSTHRLCMQVDFWDDWGLEKGKLSGTVLTYLSLPVFSAVHVLVWRFFSLSF